MHRHVSVCVKLMCRATVRWPSCECWEEWEGEKEGEGRRRGRGRRRGGGGGGEEEWKEEGRGGEGEVRVLIVQCVGCLSCTICHVMDGGCDGSSAGIMEGSRTRTMTCSWGL